MPKMHISKSIDIKSDNEKLFNTLNNFENWSAWSPWLIQEPDAKVTVSEDGKSYAWEGNRTGSGNMQITGEKNLESIDYDLTFLKPWKSTAKVRFEFKPNGDHTTVTWSMDSGLPIFLFWMKKMMTAFVGMDYERGLNMLKEYVEEGEVHSKLDFKGQGQYPGCNFVGIKRTCNMNELSTAMQEDFGKLMEHFKGKEDQIAAQPFSMYHKWDVVNQKVHYTAGMPVKEKPSESPSGLIVGNIPATPTFSIKHTGPYMHLGNAWSTLIGMQRAKTFKANKSIHPFEVYLNDPSTVDKNQLETEVNFAVK